MPYQRNVIDPKKLMFLAIKMREQIGDVATWCDRDEVGRYDLDTLINNLEAMNDPTVPTVKYLR
jgi:hypothetical protein